MRGRRRLAPPPLRRHCVARCPRRRLRRRAVRGPPAQRPRPPRARPPSPQALAVLTAAARGGRPRLPPQHGAQPRLRQVRLRGRRAPFTVCLWARAGANPHRILRLCSGSDALVLAARKGTACVSVKRTVVATVPLAAGWQLVSLAITHAAVVLAVNGGAPADARTPPFVAPGTVAVAPGTPRRRHTRLRRRAARRRRRAAGRRRPADRRGVRPRVPRALPLRARRWQAPPAAHAARRLHAPWSRPLLVRRPPRRPRVAGRRDRPVRARAVRRRALPLRRRRGDARRPRGR